MLGGHIVRSAFASRAAAASLVCAAALVAGCTTTQARSAKESGFLGDYSQLEKGKGDQALLVYVDHSASWGQYTKIQMDPVAVYANKQLEGVSADQLQTLVNHLDAKVRDKLKSDYEFVDQAGPDTMRLRIAITEAEGSHVVLDVLSTIVPAGRVLAEAKQLALGTGTFTGSAGCEAEILDSTTGTRLAAAVDRRVGRKSVSGMLSKWSDVDDAYDAWAEQLRKRLSELRSGR